MKFGVFDHFDDSGRGLGELYAERLELLKVYDRTGFYGYHIAEHHATPLGMAASPGIFLSAVATHTKNIKFGPLVYLLPFYHPMRLIEEVCMLDQMSNGRFQLGVGRGASPFEVRHYGLDFSKTQQMYHEAYRVLMAGLQTDELHFKGEFYEFNGIPVLLHPKQKPHPPLWYGTTQPGNVDWPAANDVNIVVIGTRDVAKVSVDRFRAERAKLGKTTPEPLIGITKHVVVADTDAEALAIARRAYPVWRDSFRWLFGKYKVEPPPAVNGAFPATFDELAAMGNGFAGSPATMRDKIRAEVAATGVTYFCSWLAFGDLTLAESTHSAELMSREVMPAFA